MKQLGIALLFAVLLALLAGCGGSRPPAADTPAPENQPATAQVKRTESTVAESAPTDAPAAQATEEADTEAAESEGDDIELADDESSLRNLKSYRSSWSFEWTGKKDGQDQTVKWSTVEAYTEEPRAKYTKVETSDSLEPGQNSSMEFYQIGDKSYMVSQQDGKPQCTAFTSDEDTPSGSSLDRSAFGSISSGKFVGTETVNGVRTKHYKYDETATGLAVFSRLTGDVWVAEDDKYVVKDVAEWEGGLFGILGGGSTEEKGKGAWKREVTDINAAFEITPPEGCENAAEALPMMADAAEKASFGQMTTYQSASKLKDVLKFYQDEMAKAGWQADGEGMVTDDFATLKFTKDGKTANIVLTSEESKTAVMITVE